MTVRVRVIPCLDVSNGRVVKGVNFVDLIDAGDPVEAARAYDAAGADELCFLDITASHEGRDTILDVVARTAEVCFMPLTVGGGVRTPKSLGVSTSGCPKTCSQTRFTITRAVRGLLALAMASASPGPPHIKTRSPARNKWAPAMAEVITSPTAGIPTFDSAAS